MEPGGKLELVPKMEDINIYDEECVLQLEEEGDLEGWEAGVMIGFLS